MRVCAGTADLSFGSPDTFSLDAPGSMPFAGFQDVQGAAGLQRSSAAQHQPGEPELQFGSPDHEEPLESLPTLAAINTGTSSGLGGSAARRVPVAAPLSSFDAAAAPSGSSPGGNVPHSQPVPVPAASLTSPFDQGAQQQPSPSSFGLQAGTAPPPPAVLGQAMEQEEPQPDGSASESRPG